MRAPTRWVASLLATALAATLALTTVGISPSTAATSLGPIITKTDTGPTGYEVTFRYEAPADVTSVQIYGEWFFSRAYSLLAQNGGDARTGEAWQKDDIVAGPWTSREMTKGVDGVWTWTTPLPSGTFSYGFYHNGSTSVRYSDPANPGFSQTVSWNQQNMSQVYVPQSTTFPTYDNDYQAPTATGELLQLSYPTPLAITPTGHPVAADGQHAVSVYLPEGYDPNRAEPYPTLYLSHGGQGVDTDWFTQGVAQDIVENAIADGDAEQMVVVATNYQGFHASFNSNSTEAISTFADDLVQYGIPAVEANFNVSKKSVDRAFGSLSAGGLRLLEFLYNRPGVFEYYGLWSAGGNSPMPTLQQTENISKTQGIIQIGVGYQDWQNSINALSYARAGEIRRSSAVVDEWNTYGIHSWDVWRQELNYFIRNDAFKDPHGRLDASTPTISGGTVRVGTTLTATVPVVRSATGAVVPDPEVTYQWQRGGVAIADATKAKYTATAADAGMRLGLKITLSKSGYGTVSAQSSLTRAVRMGVIRVATRAKVDGTAKVGKKLTVTGPTVNVSDATFTYRWLRDGKPIAGAKAAKAAYRLTAKDKGTKISVRVTVKKAGYNAETSTSPMTTAVMGS